MDHLSDNTVEYYLYHRKITSTSDDSLKQFDDLIVEYYAHLAEYLIDYIWQNEPFNLRVVQNQREQYIYGRTNFEENIEDEWFIVFLLKQLTLFDPNLIIKVNDDDGEFLLIESAQYLERWAQEPSKTYNRVFLHRGALHLISPKKFSKDILSNDNIENYLNLIITQPDKTHCNGTIQNCINNRIKHYPDAIYTTKHRAHCSLPPSIILLLESNPKLVAYAVRAFYYRTPDDNHSIRSIKSINTDHCLVANVQFSRCLYAQLNSQPFVPKEGSHEDFNISSYDEKTKNIAINGIKLVIGFKILIAHFLNKNTKQFQINEDKWNNFLEQLKIRNDIINDETKVQKCKTFLEEIQRTEEKCCYTEDYGKVIYQFIENINSQDIERIMSTVTEPADDETWLDINQEDFDRLLSEKFGCSESNDIQQETIDSLKKIPNSLQKFILNQKSGLDGIETAKESNCSNKVDFNENAFSNFMNKVKDILGDDRIISDDEHSYSSDDSYDGDEEDEENEEDEDMKAYLKSMHQELRQTIINNSSTKHSGKETSELDSDDDSEQEEDMNLNVMANILESYNAEKEVANISGPATTLFASIGVKLPEKDIEETKK